MVINSRLKALTLFEFFPCALLHQFQLFQISYFSFSYELFLKWQIGLPLFAADQWLEREFLEFFVIDSLLMFCQLPFELSLRLSVLIKSLTRSQRS